MHTKSGLPSSAQPWGRSIDKRLATVERRVGLTADVLEGMQSAVDKTVTAEFPWGQNIANGVTGRVELDYPAQVQFVSSTGLFEVTISASMLLMAGATLGIGFECEEYPEDIYFDLPKYGVSASSANADVRWAPFAMSRSTVLTNRPGVYNISTYAWANCTLTASAQAYIRSVNLSVKAV